MGYDKVKYRLVIETCKVWRRDLGYDEAKGIEAEEENNIVGLELGGRVGGMENDDALKDGGEL